MGLEIDELGMNKCMNHDWLNIGMRLLCLINLWLVSETWLWYEIDIIS